MNIYNYINDLDITLGETKRMNCPICNGYNTFTVTNNMGNRVWNCYKVSCNAKGNAKYHLTVDEIRNYKKDKSSSEEFVLPEYITKSSSKYVKDWFISRGINPDNVNYMYDVKENRVVFPIVHGNKIIDATGRSLGKKLPKWKRYGSNGLPFVSGFGNVAVVVEDCLSAIVVGGQTYMGVAILGTSLSDEHKRYLSKFPTVIIALDPDALPKTMQYAKELRGYVKNVKILKLTDDLKYCREEDLINLKKLTPNGETNWNYQ